MFSVKKNIEMPYGVQSQCLYCPATDATGKAIVFAIPLCVHGIHAVKETACNANRRVPNVHILPTGEFYMDVLHGGSSIHTGV